MEKGEGSGKGTTRQSLETERRIRREILGVPAEACPTPLGNRRKKSGKGRQTTGEKKKRCSGQWERLRVPRRIKSRVVSGNTSWESFCPGGGGPHDFGRISQKKKRGKGGKSKEKKDSLVLTPNEARHSETRYERKKPTDSGNYTVQSPPLPESIVMKETFRGKRGREGWNA